DIGAADGEYGLELIHPVDLDLDPEHVGGMGPCGPEGRLDPSGCGDVVVLDQDGVGKAEAVVRAASVEDGLFLDEAQARCRLSRAGDAGAGTAGFGDMTGGQGRDSGEPAGEVQRHPLGGKDRGRGPAISSRLSPAAQVLPSGTRTSTRSVGSSRRNVSAAICMPETTPGSRARKRASQVVPAGITARVVTSPQGERSSSSAARTSGWSRNSGRAMLSVMRQLRQTGGACREPERASGGGGVPAGDQGQENRCGNAPLAIPCASARQPRQASPSPSC